MQAHLLPLIAAGLFTLAASASATAQGKQVVPAAPIQPAPPAPAAPAIEVKPLTIGDRAPAIDVAHWMKGEAVREFEAGKVYVMEFWATWCGPCRAGMPHISELQAKFREYGVTIVGVSSEEKEVVEKWMASSAGDAEQAKMTWADRMGYTVAVDTDRSVSNEYMRAAGQRFIPTAFIVGKSGLVEWVGSPRVMEEVIEAVLHDSWDRESFKVKFEEKRRADEAQMKLDEKLRSARKNGDWNAVVAALDEAISANPKDLNLKMDKFQTLLVSAGRPADAYAFGTDLLSASWDDPMVLNTVAWFVVDAKGVEPRDLAFAMKAISRAAELTKQGDPAILDTLARIHFEAGDVAKAIEIQEKAVALVDPASSMAEGIRNALERYRKKGA